jgi:hypothetical protein
VGVLDGFAVGVFVGAIVGRTLGASVGAAVHSLHCTLPHSNPFVHEQRFLLHSASAQLQNPFKFPGIPHCANSSSLQPNLAVGADVGFIVVGALVGFTVGAPVGAAV